MSKVSKKTLRPANDNQSKSSKAVPGIVQVWPKVVPVTCAELDLLELYFKDFLGSGADNDN